MQVRITFEIIEDEDDEELTYLLIKLLLDRADELLYRRPDYVIRGRHKVTLTIYGLSVNEAEILHRVGSNEITDEGIVRRVTIINSKLDEDTGPYRFTIPEYAEGAREQLSENKKFNLDVDSFVSWIVQNTIDSIENVYYEDAREIFGESVGELTTRAVAKYETRHYLERAPEDPEDMEDYLTEIIANEPMYKERIRRPKKPHGRKNQPRRARARKKGKT